METRSCGPRVAPPGAGSRGGEPSDLGLDAAALDAIELSVFARTPPRVLASMLAGHCDRTWQSGDPLLPRLLPRHRTGLVVSGLLRLYVAAPDGRQVVARYCGPGYFLGAASVMRSRKVLRVRHGVEAVTPTRVLHLDRECLHEAAHTESGVALALLEQLGEYQTDLAHALASTAFGSIRERAAIHLLSLSIVQPDGTVVVPVTQQGLADAVGTTRETVARALGGLRRVGAIETGVKGIRVLDAERLAAEARWIDGA